MKFPKTGDTPKRRRARRRRRMVIDAAADKREVWVRQNGACFALGVSPVCRGRMDDPHELIPVGVGGPRISSNRVGLCRVDHRMAQGRVGGNWLKFSWPGKEAGQLPNADLPGNVQVTWCGPTGVDAKRFERFERLGRRPANGSGQRRQP